MSKLTSDTIPSLLNGVSQQTPNLRLPSQAEVQENGLSSPVDGLVKRPPFQHVALLREEPFLVAPLVHTINRDESEQYTLIMEDGDLKVYDLKTGKPQVVNFPHGKDYLKAPFPREDLTALTVEDYTFILNRNRVPTMAIPPASKDDRLLARIKFKTEEIEPEVEEPPPPEIVERYQTWALVSEPPASTYKFSTNQYIDGNTNVPFGTEPSASIGALRAQVAAYWDARGDKPFASSGAPNYNALVALEYKFSATYKLNDPTAATLPGWISALSNTSSAYVVPIVAHFTNGETKNYRMVVRMYADLTVFTDTDDNYGANVLIPVANLPHGAETDFTGVNPFRVARKMATEPTSALGAAGEIPVLLYDVAPAEGQVSGPVKFHVGTVADKELPYPVTYPTWSGLADYTKTW